jgi:GNAT superfamily N-acetyltransferase
MNARTHSRWDTPPLNRIKNIATIGYFENYPVEDCFMEGSSAMLLGKSDHLWAHITSNSKGELSALLRKHSKKTRFFHSVEDWMIPLILEHDKSEWILTSNRFLLKRDVSVGFPNMEIAHINKALAPYILENSEYTSYVSVQYIEERLKKDVSACILVDKKMVAWGLTHDDGSLGFLHVLEAYRKKGFAEKILRKLIQLKRDSGSPVFGNIVPGNSASTTLVHKLGFEFDQKSSWIKLM